MRRSKKGWGAEARHAPPTLQTHTHTEPERELAQERLLRPFPSGRSAPLSLLFLFPPAGSLDTLARETSEHDVLSGRSAGQTTKERPRQVCAACRRWEVGVRVDEFSLRSSLLESVATGCCVALPRHDGMDSQVRGELLPNRPAMAWKGFWPTECQMCTRTRHPCRFGGATLQRW